jgi:predicted GIY-YIG superfamily endonuclease
MPYYVYVLQLQDGKWYIGTSDDVERRYVAHVAAMAGSPWTELHPPRRLFRQEQRQTQQEALALERELTATYVLMFGLQNVRGAGFTRVDPSRGTMINMCDECAQRFDLDYGTTRTRLMRDVEAPAAAAPPVGGGHFPGHPRPPFQGPFQQAGLPRFRVPPPFAPRVVRRPRPPPPFRNRARNGCFRCGNEGHMANACWARWDVDGFPLDDSDEEY